MNSRAFRSRLCMMTALITLASCSHKTAVLWPTQPPNEHADWLDLDAGWRIRVVTPVLSSGDDFVVDTEPVEATDPTPGRDGTLELTLTAKEEILGIETSLYSVRSARGGGVHVRFQSAEVRLEEAVSRRPRPLHPLFQFPDQARFVRMLFMVRRSEADHNMAILAADGIDALALLTEQVRANPQTCRDAEGTYCSWVPDGIAVIPERRVPNKGTEEWTPVI